MNPLITTQNELLDLKRKCQLSDPKSNSELTTA